MKLIKYFIQFLFIITLFLIFKILGLKIASYISSKITSFFGPFFRSKDLIRSNILKALPNINQNEIKTTLKLNNINSDYYFDKNVEYEINAAINFELMCKAKNFIGLSRSTFSNLITLKRHLLNNNNSFIYNYNNQIIERLDKGLHPDGKSAVTNTVLIV